MRFFLPPLSLPLALAVLAGCTMNAQQTADQAAEDARDFAKAIGNRVPGPPQRCIDPDLVNGPQIIGDDTLIYRESGRRLWVTKVQSCPGLRGDPIIVTQLYGSQMCEKDRFRPVPRGSRVPGPICFFGTFTPYDRPSR